MNTLNFVHTQKVLKNVSFDPNLFSKEVEKAIKTMLPYEIDELVAWLQQYIKEKPELGDYQDYINSIEVNF
ncbi:MAG: hypothetical protein ACI7YS_07680 [Flavobacterium sp.]